jgi:hypothetical protein
MCIACLLSVSFRVAPRAGAGLDDGRLRVPLRRALLLTGQRRGRIQQFENARVPHGVIHAQALFMVVNQACLPQVA